MEINHSVVDFHPPDDSFRPSRQVLSDGETDAKEETGKEEKALPEEPAASVKRKGRGQRPLSDYRLP